MERRRARAFDEILRFWFGRGVSGFRIDVSQPIVKDLELRDDPAATTTTRASSSSGCGARIINRPELHELAALAPPRRGQILVGETYVLELEQLIPFYGTGRDELHLAFNFLFGADSRGADAAAQDRGQAARGGVAVWTGSANHDGQARRATRWAGGDERKARGAADAADAAPAARSSTTATRSRCRTPARLAEALDRVAPPQREP